MDTRGYLVRGLGIVACIAGVLPLACSRERCRPVAHGGSGPSLDPNAERVTDSGLPICGIAPYLLACLTRVVPVPRCAAADLDCGPELLPGQCYRPSARRKAVGVHDPFRAGFPCTYDGECVLGGCGNACVGYTTPPFASTCELQPGLEHALCGCVQGYCGFFVQ
jgi:hypothetical protein